MLTRTKSTRYVWWSITWCSVIKSKSPSGIWSQAKKSLDMTSHMSFCQSALMDRFCWPRLSIRRYIHKLPVKTLWFGENSLRKTNLKKRWITATFQVKKRRYTLCKQSKNLKSKSGRKLLKAMLCLASHLNMFVWVWLMHIQKPLKCFSKAYSNKSTIPIRKKF